MLKKIISILMCTAVILPLLSFSGVKVSAADYDIDRLVSIAEKFPGGKYWNHIGSSANNPDGYTSTPCTRHSSHCGNGCGCNSFLGAMQCMGYAYKLANELVGTDPRTWEKRKSLNVSSLRVGDIIRYLNNGHSIVVVGVSGNTIAYTGANWGRNCLIKWGTMNVSKLKGFSYVLHDKNNKLKNSDLSFFDGVKAKSRVNFVKAASGSDCEEWKNTTKETITVYNLPLKNGFKISSVKKNKTLKIVEKTFDGKTLWGKIKTEKTEGWVKLNKLTFTGGNYKKPKTEEIKNASTGKRFTVKWNKIDGATSYTVKITKKGRSGVYKTYTAEKNKVNIKLYEKGIYSVYIIAENEFAPSWLVQGKKTTFEVKQSKKRVDSGKSASAKSLKKSSVVSDRFIEFFSMSTAV